MAGVWEATRVPLAWDSADLGICAFRHRLQQPGQPRWKLFLQENNFFQLSSIHSTVGDFQEETGWIPAM